MRHWPLLSIALTATLGCAGPRMRQGELYAGRTDGPPSIECLPDPDVEDAELTEHMRFGMRLATEALALRAPEAPADTSSQSILAWSQGPLQEWLRVKSEAVAAARHELDLAAEESHRQRIMGGAIVGMLYEDLATAMRTVPTPADLLGEPDVLRMFQQVIDDGARPYFETARLAYHACELNGTSPRTMRHWSDFCSQRRDGLPFAPDEEDGTTVEVLRD